MAKPESITALILAGGQSRRMGTDKALQQWQGIPLIQRVASVAAQCGVAVYVCTPWPERYRSVLPPSTHWIVESPLFQGPLVALAHGFDQIATPWVWLLACDLPQLAPPVLQRWLQALPTNSLQMAYVPHTQRGWEPLCGFYHRQSLASLRTYLAQQGDRASFQDWLTHLPAVPLRVEAAIAPMFHNCNTPDDLR